MAVRPGARNRVFVDSGAWIALLSARDGHHREAEAMFRAAIAQRRELLTSNLIVAEVHRFILFHAGIEAAAVALARIDASALVRLQFATLAHHGAARAWLERFDDQKFSYTDAVSFAMMETSGSRVAMSFDHDFVVAGFQLWSL
jgi:hypothetical protein